MQVHHASATGSHSCCPLFPSLPSVKEKPGFEQEATEVTEIIGSRFFSVLCSLRLLLFKNSKAGRRSQPDKRMVGIGSEEGRVGKEGTVEEHLRCKYTMHRQRVSIPAVLCFLRCLL